jgi:hypothetical protein
MIFLILPWLYFQNRRGVDDFSVSANSFIYFMSIGSIILFYLNTKSIIQTKGKERTVAILFVIPPILILAYFTLGYFAFSGFTGI